MLDEGMNIIRMDFANGDRKEHGDYMTNLREAMGQRPDKPCALMFDTKGPVIKTGNLRDGKPVELTAGQELKVATDPNIEGDNKTITCDYKGLTQTVNVGSQIYINYGACQLEVTEVHDEFVITAVKNPY